ncbi:hypothetical protein [Chryseobacterium daeguense]|uniref:hypothetical protein n=1 Tax=Chryseobacterium daeguense TaxID=412438 RepID=UPI0012DEDB5E|nr:hypothetical protein [Chryseobacterium daeguense]
MIKCYLLLARSAQIRGFQTRSFVTVPWFSKNYQQITFAKKNPDKVPPYGRLGALAVTSHYKEDEVGYGVHAATILIYFIFRDIGQLQVGEEFGKKYAVDVLKSQRNFGNNKLFGRIDQGYWILNRGKGATIPDNMVIWLGANINPTIRAIIQDILAEMRKRSPQS